VVPSAPIDANFAETLVREAKSAEFSPMDSEERRMKIDLPPSRSMERYPLTGAPESLMQRIGIGEPSPKHILGQLLRETCSKLEFLYHALVHRRVTLSLSNTVQHIG
jgi:hypothetical protein